MVRRGENIYMRKDGRFEGRYIKGRRPDGSIIYGSVYGHSIDEVRDKLAAKTGASPARTDAKSSISFSGYLSAWLEETVRVRVKPSSFARYHERINSYIIPALGGLMLQSITKDDIQRFADNLHIHKKLSHSTIESIFVTLRSSLKDAAEAGLIEADPSAGVAIPKIEREDSTRVLSYSEQSLVVSAAERVGRSVELSVLLSLFAGLSTGEMCALRWRDADFRSGTLIVGNVLQRVRVFDGSDAKTELIEAPQKGRRAMRRIPLPLGLVEKLREYSKGILEDCYILSGTVKPVEPRRIRAWLAKAAEESGFDVSFQVLRRTYIEQCVLSNCGEDTLTRMLGSSGTRIIERVMAYSALEHGRQVAERVWSARYESGGARKLSIENSVKTSG